MEPTAEEQMAVVTAAAAMELQMWAETNAQTQRVIEILRLGTIRILAELNEHRQRMFAAVAYQQEQRALRIKRRRERLLEEEKVETNTREKSPTKSNKEVGLLKDALEFERQRAEAYRNIALMLAHHGFIKRREMINMLKGLTTKEDALERYMTNEVRCDELMQDQLVLQKDRAQVMGIMAQFFNSAILFPEGVMKPLNDDPESLSRFTTHKQYKEKMAHLNESIAVQKEAVQDKKPQIRVNME